jgi:hypothetical protein
MCLIDPILDCCNTLSYPIMSYPVHRDNKGKFSLIVPTLAPPNDNAGTPCFAQMLMVYIACDKVNVVPIGKSQR